MSGHRTFTEIPKSALRDHGERDRIDRIWRRVEQELPVREPRRVSSARLVWAPALALATFGAGIYVGALWFAAPPPPPPVVSIEPAATAEPAAAPAVTETRTVEGARRQRAPSRRRATKALMAPSSPKTEKTETPEPAAAASTAVMVAPAGPPEWQLLADEGSYVEALSAVEREGGFDAVLSAATAEQLMLLVDVARATGQRDRAIVALRRVVSQHGADPNAPVAAWMLGNELAKAGDPDGAAQAFAMYRALSPQGDFAEDALARQFDVAIEQSNLEHVRRLAEQYAKDFPDGPRGEEIRAQLLDLEQRLLADHVADTASEAQAVDEPPPAERPEPSPAPAPDPGRVQ